MKKANILNTFYISIMCLIITKPQENPWSAQKTFICRESGKRLWQVMKGQGCARAIPSRCHRTIPAPWDQHCPWLSAGCCHPLGPARRWGCFVPTQPSVLGVPEYSVRPVQPASCSTPAVPLCCSCNSACWHLSVLKACPDQQPDIRKE